jgi:programmed cell death 6-interacting protein
MPVPYHVLPLKVPVRHDLVQPLSVWLDSDEQGVSYHNNDDNVLSWVVPKPEFWSTDCREEILRLAALRNDLSENLQESHKSSLELKALEDCQEYHATLLEFEKRGFPTVDDETNGIALTWRGAFATRQQETHNSLVYDRACTMWNVAALQSSLASTADCSSKEGCKIAISLSQSAASILATLRQLVENDDYETVDFSTSMISFWEKIFLAQGQLSIYKMCNLGDGTVRQHTTLAYLVQAAASLVSEAFSYGNRNLSTFSDFSLILNQCEQYNEALTVAREPRLQSEVPKQAKAWAVHCKNQSLICQSRSVFHIAIEHRLKQEHGLEIGRLRQCVQTLKETLDFAKTSDIQFQMQEVEGLVNMAKDRLVHAEEDNNTIYLDDVPKDSPEIRAQTMVKQNLPLPPTMMVTKMPMFAFT